MRSLFDITPKPVETPKVENTSTIASRSEIDGWVSIYQPVDGSDRFVLITPKGEKYTCKFYNSESDSFIGQSALAMYNLKEHFDRNIIPKDVSL